MPSRHQWIFDVLTDLRRYALANGLPALARKAEEAIETARAEIAALPPEADADNGSATSHDAADAKTQGPGRRDKLH